MEFSCLFISCFDKNFVWSLQFSWYFVKANHLYCRLRLPQMGQSGNLRMHLYKFQFFCYSLLDMEWLHRHSVGRPAPSASLDLKASAFDPKEKVWTRFPPEGSKYTPPHQSTEFKWKDYCPLVFRYRLCIICAAAVSSVLFTDSLA